MQDFRDLKVWQKGHELVLMIYRATASFPQTELYGLSSQLRRAVVSIPTNLAEGCCRGSDRDFARFAQIAMGSASEVEYLVLLARDLKYLPADGYEHVAGTVGEIKRMLAGLLDRLNEKSR